MVQCTSSTPAAYPMVMRVRVFLKIKLAGSPAVDAQIDMNAAGRHFMESPQVWDAPQIAALPTSVTSGDAPQVKMAA